MDSISRHEQLLRVFHLIDILFGARQPLTTAASDTPAVHSCSTGSMVATQWEHAEPRRSRIGYGRLAYLTVLLRPCPLFVLLVCTCRVRICRTLERLL
jgi:hypothetical protein